MNSLPTCLLKYFYEFLTYADRCSFRQTCKKFALLKNRFTLEYWFKRNDIIITNLKFRHFIKFAHKYGSRKILGIRKNYYYMFKYFPKLSTTEKFLTNTNNSKFPLLCYYYAAQYDIPVSQNIDQDENWFYIDALINVKDQLCFAPEHVLYVSSHLIKSNKINAISLALRNPCDYVSIASKAISYGHLELAEVVCQYLPISYAEITMIVQNDYINLIDIKYYSIYIVLAAFLGNLNIVNHCLKFIPATSKTLKYTIRSAILANNLNILEILDLREFPISLIKYAKTSETYQYIFPFYKKNLATPLQGQAPAEGRRF